MGPPPAAWAHGRANRRAGVVGSTQGQRQELSMPLNPPHSCAIQRWPSHSPWWVLTDATTIDDSILRAVPALRRHPRGKRPPAGRQFVSIVASCFKRAQWRVVFTPSRVQPKRVQPMPSSRGAAAYRGDPPSEAHRSQYGLRGKVNEKTGAMILRLSPAPCAMPCPTPPLRRHRHADRADRRPNHGRGRVRRCNSPSRHSSAPGRSRHRCRIY